MKSPESSPNNMVQPQRAADILTREVPHTEAADFVHGCEVLSKIIAKEKPDIIFFPQRGAGPMEWTTEALIEQSNVTKPKFVDLPIGTHTLVNEEGLPLSGIKGGEKQALIEETIARLEAVGDYVPGKTRLMLVDEVQKGGTISQATHALSEAMKRRDDQGLLSVVAFQDSRNDLIGDDRIAAYQRIASNQRSGVKTTVLPTALFMVDRPQFLDTILKTTKNTLPSLDDYIIDENASARRMFRALAEVYSDPKRAMDEIESLRRNAVAHELGQTILQNEILEAVTDPVPVRNDKHATEAHVLGWWTNYTKSIDNSRLSERERSERLNASRQ